MADYRLAEPAADAVAVLDALGVESAHVIGHDWGAQVGWLLAASTRDRVRTLTAVSVPHPRALRLAMRVRPSSGPGSRTWRCSGRRSAERLLLAGNAAVLKADDAARSATRADLYADAMREPGRLTGGTELVPGAGRRPAGGRRRGHRADHVCLAATGIRCSA